MIKEIIIFCLLSFVAILAINTDSDDNTSKTKTQAEILAIECMKQAKDDIDEQRICSSNFIRDSNIY